jgi:hypothetical protein
LQQPWPMIKSSMKICCWALAWLFYNRKIARATVK